MQSQQLRAGPNASKILHRKGFTRGYVPLWALQHLIWK
jgi:hypothetical protein